MDVRAYQVARIAASAGDARRRRPHGVDPLDPARGLILGVGISGVFWAMLVLLILRGLF